MNAETLNGVTKRSEATINWDAERWELYTASMDCTTAAAAINSAIEAAYNSGASREETGKAAIKVMHKYASFGAVDSEPLSHLSELLDQLYGRRDQ